MHRPLRNSPRSDKRSRNEYALHQTGPHQEKNASALSAVFVNRRTRHPALKVADAFEYTEFGTARFHVSQ